MISTKKFVRKPLYVDAVQITVENFEDIAKWCQGTIVNNDGTPTNGVNPKKQHVRVRVLYPMKPRQTKAFVGDWLLYTERGYKIYTNKAFIDTFDEAPTPLVPPQDSPNNTGVPTATSE